MDVVLFPCAALVEFRDLHRQRQVPAGKEIGKMGLDDRKQVVADLEAQGLLDGIEDYEYFYLLRNLLETRGGKISDDLRTRAEKALAVPEEIAANNKKFTEDPNLLLRARADIAGLIGEMVESAR